MASAIDPICAMTVDPETADFRADHDGTAYFFCSSDCQEEFAANPADYAV